MQRGRGWELRTWTLETGKLGFLLWVHFIMCKVGLAVPASREFVKIQSTWGNAQWVVVSVIIVINPDGLFSLVEVSSNRQFYKPAEMVISELPTDGCFGQRELFLRLPRPFWSCINSSYWSDTEWIAKCISWSPGATRNQRTSCLDWHAPREWNWFCAERPKSVTGCRFLVLFDLFLLIQLTFIENLELY